MWCMMSKLADKLFEAYFALTDARKLLRDTAPDHKFSKDQKAEMKGFLKKAADAIKALEAEVR